MIRTADYDILSFGNEQEPIVIIDDFSSDPEGLRAAAAGLTFERRGPYYPGIRAGADPSYLRERSESLRQILSDVFGVSHGAGLVECNYSLVTTRPEDLSVIQRLPHFDSTDRGRFALLHYLSNEKAGGTAFFRHRATGFETVSAERLDTYNAALAGEAEKLGLPPAEYYRGDTDQFEQIGLVEARPNRLAIYRGLTLHSGIIPEDFSFEASPATGRLTVNTFLQANA